MGVVSRRAVLWIAFVLVHAAVAWLGYAEPNAPMGDVYLVYEHWSGCIFWPASIGADICGADAPFAAIPGVTESWVYPQLALVPMILTWAFAWAISYTPAWALLVTIVDAVAFAALVGKGRSTGRAVAAAFWLAFILLLGPVGLYRLEGITVPLAILGCLWLVRRPWLASVLLAVATWIKVWPAALLAAALITLRRRVAIIGGAAIVSVATLAVVFAAGGGRFAFGFVGDQTTRGLQIEAPISSFYLWGATFGIPDWWVYYDPYVLTFQVTGPNVDTVIAAMTPLMGLAMLAVVAIGAYKAWRGAGFGRLFAPLSLALVLAFIVFNKVGSPQYVAWLAAPVVLGLVIERARWIRPAAFVLVIALVTQFIYPLTYGGLMRRIYLDPLPVALLTIRNALLAVLLVWMVVRLVRVPVPERARRPFAGRFRLPGAAPVAPVAPPAVATSVSVVPEAVAPASTGPLPSAPGAAASVAPPPPGAPTTP
jgi:hypothetical protein